MSDDKSLHVLLKPLSNKNNKKIIDYLTENQKKINNNNMIIKPQIMNPDKIDDFVKIGVNNLPSLLYNGKIVYGVNEIIKYINNLCTDVDNKPIKLKKDSGDDDIRAYMLDAALNGEEGDMETPISEKEIRAKTRQFDNTHHPKNKSNNKNNKSNSDYNYNDTIDLDEEEEDDMMSAWLANAEETDV